jgi:hypothetical protein
MRLGYSRLRASWHQAFEFPLLVIERARAVEALYAMEGVCLRRFKSAWLVSATILPWWPASGQETNTTQPASSGVCAHIRVVPKANVDSAMVLKSASDVPDKAIFLVASLPPICEQKKNDSHLRKESTAVLPVSGQGSTGPSEEYAKTAPTDSEGRDRLKQ